MRRAMGVSAAVGTIVLALVLVWAAAGAAATDNTKVGDQAAAAGGREISGGTGAAGKAPGGDKSTAAAVKDMIKPGEPTATATIHCIGVMWPVEGDLDGSARCEMSFREAGGEKWLPALALHRKAPVEVDWAKGTVGGRAISGQGRYRPWRGGMKEYGDERWPSNYLAGSIFGLRPGTKYDVMLKLTDGDAKTTVEKKLGATTRTEPVIPEEGNKVEVTAEGGAKALAAALAGAKAGDIIIVHKGTYAGPFAIKASGTAEKPIVMRGAGDGPAVIKGTGYVKEGSETGNICLQIDGSYVYVTGMEFDDAVTAINIGLGRFGGREEWDKLQAGGGMPSNVVITRSRTTRTQYAICGTANECYVADNDLNGLAADVEGIDWSEGEGVEIHGSGTVVCYNRMYHLADAVSIYDFTSNQDFYNNDAYSLSDDGIEVDFGEVNNRVWDNRFWFPANNGVSFQPFIGGPVYIIRNEVIGPRESCLKDRYKSSDGYFFNNTFIGHKAKPELGTNCRLAHFDMPMKSVSRNNLYIIQEGTDEAAVNVHPEDVADRTIDMDYDGLGGIFMISSGNGGRDLDAAQFAGSHYVEGEGLYIPIESFQKTARTLGHYTVVDPAKIFAKALPALRDWREEGERPLMLLEGGCNAIDAGVALPTITDGYTGKAPDLGAHEFGRPVPHYGPR